MSLRKQYLRLAQKAITLLEDSLQDNYVKAYLFGSVSKGKVKEDSDIDILLIGKEKKTICLLSRLSGLMDSISNDIEINIVYFEYSVFKTFVINKNNLFLNSIEKDCISKEVINELL